MDEIDQALVELLNQRAQVSIRVGQLKEGLKANVFVPEREAQVLRNVETWNQGPMPAAAMRQFWLDILSTSRRFQQKARIGYLGPIATFSYEAALVRFGREAELVPYRTIPEVFAATTRREVDYGVVPIENSIEGGVTFSLDTFVECDVQVCAEVKLPISQHLISTGTLESIEKVYSHPMGIAQGRKWILSNLPRAEIIETTSTSRGAELAKSDPKVAGVGSELSAELFGVPILARNIEERSNNFTRFFVIGDHSARATGQDRTAIVFAIRLKAGALHDALGIFAAAGLNLTRIESRPTKKELWEYVFYAEFQGHRSDKSVAESLAVLEGEAQFVKILGSWPEES